MHRFVYCNVIALYILNIIIIIIDRDVMTMTIMIGCVRAEAEKLRKSRPGDVKSSARTRVLSTWKEYNEKKETAGLRRRCD